MAKKEFKDYWTVIRIPFFVLVGWSLASLVIALVSFSTFRSIFTGLTNTVLAVAVFAFLGYTAVKDYSFEKGETAKAGAFCGVLAGFAGAIISIIMVNLVPQVVEFAMAQAMERGGAAVNPETIEKMINIGIYLGLVTGPIINGIIGAVIAWITSLVVKR